MPAREAVLLHPYCCVALVYLACLLVSAGVYAFAQEAPIPSKPGPATPGLLPPRQEQVLSPIPEQFDWMSRDVRPNPLLEALVDLQERPPRLFMSGSLTEEYSDNFSRMASDRLSQPGRNRADEYRTRLGLGTVYRLIRGPSFISLANSLSVDYQARAEQTNAAFANLSLNAGYQLPQLWLVLSESFIRDDSGEASSPTSLRRERSIFLRNSVNPQLRYAFSRSTSGTLAYTNTLVLNEDQARGNTTSHVFTTGLQHQFTRLLRGNVRYTFTTATAPITTTTATATEAGASQAHSASADMEYTFGRRTSARLETFAALTERSGLGTDSHTYGASVGVRQQFTPSLGAFVSLGATVLEQNGNQRFLQNWQVSLDGAWPITRRLSLTLSSQQNIADTAGEVDNVGLVLRQSVALNLHHTVSRRLHTSLFVEFTRTELLESIGTSESVQGRKDTSLMAGARASYALTRILSLSADYFHQRRDSNLPGGDFDENRLTVALSAGFPVF